MARPRGSKDKVIRQTAARKQAFAAIAAAEGKTPLQVMLEDMRAKYDVGDLDGAATRAESCAPYVHARLSSAVVTHRDAIDDLTIDELRSLLAAAERSPGFVREEDPREAGAKAAGKSARGLPSVH